MKHKNEANYCYMFNTNNNYSNRANDSFFTHNSVFVGE
jgi:hypothetical protein